MSKVQKSGLRTQHTDLFAPWTTCVALLAWVALLVAAIVVRKRYPLLLLAVVYMIITGLIVLAFRWFENRVPSRVA